MHVRKSVLVALLMTIATSATIGVYALTNYSNVLTSSSNVSAPNLSIQWTNSPPSSTVIGETWFATIQITNNNKSMVSGFSIVFEVTAPVLSSSAVTLSGLYGDTSYLSSISGTTGYSSSFITYTYSGLMIPSGVSTLLIRGRYNAAGSYSWKVAISPSSSSSYY